MSSNPLLDTLAAGDFGALAEQFTRAGFWVSVPGPGMVQILSRSSKSEPPKLALSVGIHGNETAPIEMMADILGEFIRIPVRLMVDLLLVIGNIAAIAQSRRFVEIDMNRLFRPGTPDEPAGAESDRANDIMAVTKQFFAHEGNSYPKNNSAKIKWHLDLHSTIRPSLYSRFAIVPDATVDMSDVDKSQALSSWLACAGIEAIVRNSLPASTYSAFSSRLPGVTSATLELGKVSTLGSSPLDPLKITRDALVNLMAGFPPAIISSAPVRFLVAQEIVKLTESFELWSDIHTKNFTEIAPNTTIAVDGAKVYSTRDRAEYLLFPNPSVKVGQRAGLMLYVEGANKNSGILTAS
jgi:succinylglutamate desuccinylase